MLSFSHMLSHVQSRVMTNIYIFRHMDVVEWSRALDVRLSEWFCSVSMVNGVGSNPVEGGTKI